MKAKTPPSRFLRNFVTGFTLRPVAYRQPPDCKTYKARGNEEDKLHGYTVVKIAESSQHVDIRHFTLEDG